MLLVGRISAGWEGEEEVEMEPEGHLAFSLWAFRHIKIRTQDIALPLMCILKLPNPCRVSVPHPAVSPGSPDGPASTLRDVLMLSLLTKEWFDKRKAPLNTLDGAYQHGEAGGKKSLTRH